MRKWVVLGAGVVLQALLGGVYAWSAFVPSLSSDYGLSNAQCGFIFGSAIAVFTMAMVPAGRLLRRIGAPALASIGACLFASGYLVASFSGGQFTLLLLGIGVITGTGIGAAYVCPLTVCMQWFPRHKGLVTGCAVAGFGGGAIGLSAMADYFLRVAGWNVLDVFRLIGIVCGAGALGAAMLLRAPAPIWIADGDAGTQESIRKHLFSVPFLLLCIGMFAGTFAGLLAVGNLGPLMLAAGLSGEAATLAISIFALGNAAGRIVWGQVHDRLESRATILLSLGLLAASLVSLLSGMPSGPMLLAVFFCGCGFGACFVVYPAAVVQRFGMAQFTRLYPICFLGYGLAGLIAPGLGGRIADATGSYTAAVVLCLVTVLVALVAIGVVSLMGAAVWTPADNRMADCLD